MVSVQVIILTYKNRFNFLENALDSLKGNELIKDVLIVDNGCTYCLEEKVSIIKNDFDFLINTFKVLSPIGTAKGFCEAIKKINKSNTHLLILDDDNTLQGNLSSLRGDFKGKVIINLLRDGREPYSSHFETGGELRILKNSFMGFSFTSFFKKNKIKSGYDVGFVQSDFLPYGGTLVPISVFNEVSINQDFILYHDDIDFFYRCKKKGYKLIITKKCTVKDIDTSWHDREKNLLDSIEESPVNIYYAIRNKIFFEKAFVIMIYTFY